MKQIKKASAFLAPVIHFPAALLTDGRTGNIMEKKPNVIYIPADDPGSAALPNYCNSFNEAGNQVPDVKSITPDFDLHKRYMWKKHSDFNSLFN